ncbi:cupredoxin domain-containing protein [Effusibacillus lacus]|uniref:EfeO-type cupredoxin-like domain-containing protein n=1 Tax=Effusibacillus lacus TaxID=1348429 RepID=A0A292YPQ4_9BACL|nr:cupredoxin domain-containing protein [Effusibacillus lacus]TCS76387.1 cupredoxin-like protein [Effusibacillus lacus]GAX91928.1 hypothetical protein EFBL_3619 [Effusibacillus lacus]
MERSQLTGNKLALVIILTILVFGAAWMLNQIGSLPGIRPVHAGSPVATGNNTVKYSIVTNEIKWTSPDGKQIIEGYRWDPGTIVVRQGDSVVFEFYGVKGESHPFVIEGYNLKGNVVRGKVETVSFKADKPGTFKILCLTHPDYKSHGPMVANLVVMPN